MNELKKHRLALVFIAVLFSIKFVFVPWYEWQQALYQSNKLIQKKIEKSELLMINKDDLNCYHEQYDIALDRIKTYLYQESTGEALKLDLQKKLEQLLKVRKLNSSSIGWQNSYDYPDRPIVKHQLSLQFSGDTIDAVAFFLDLAQLPQILEYEAFNFNLLRQRAGHLGRVSVSVRVAFFELEKE